MGPYHRSTFAGVITPSETLMIFGHLFRHPITPYLLTSGAHQQHPIQQGRPVLAHIDAWVFILQCQGGYITCAASQEKSGCFKKKTRAKNRGKTLGKIGQNKNSEVSSGSKAEKFPTPHGKDGGGKNATRDQKKKTSG